jgi:hypothetical protein
MHREHWFATPGIALARSVLIVSMIANSSTAGPLYEVELDAGAVSGGAFDSAQPVDASSNPISLSVSRTVDSATGFASGASGPGSVAAVFSSTYTVTDPTNETSSFGTALVFSTIDDLVFDGTGTLNGIFLNVDLSGLMAVSGTTVLAASVLEVSFKLNNQPSSGITGRRDVQLIPGPFFIDEGVLDGVWPDGQLSYSGTIMVGPFNNVPANTPVSLEMFMQTFGFAFLYSGNSPVIGDQAVATGDMGSTLSFTSTGDVFTGPFTSVNSTQGEIQDGLWMGTPVSAVPEPSESSLVALCTLGVIYARRKRVERRPSL